MQDTAAEDEKRRAHEEAEAKRKAEWEQKQLSLIHIFDSFLTTAFQFTTNEPQSYVCLLYTSCEK